MILLKSERDLEAMRPACTVAGTVLDEVAAFIQPGMTTRDVDEYAASRIKHYGAKSAFCLSSNYGCAAIYIDFRRNLNPLSHSKFGRKRRSGCDDEFLRQRGCISRLIISTHGIDISS